MKICLIAPGPDAAGGCGHSAAALAELLSSRHEVVLIPSDDVPDEGLEGLSFAGAEHRRSAAAMEAIRERYGSAGPDYLEVPDRRAHGLVALQARLTGDPLLRDTLVGVRIGPSSELLDLHDGTLRQPGREQIAMLEREQLRLADRLIWAGGDSIELYRRHYAGAGLPEAVQIRPAVAGGGETAVPVSPGPGPLRILYVADLRRHRGALDLVEACLTLPDDGWELTMVGADTATAAMGQSVRLTIEAMGGDDPRIRIEEPAPGERPALEWSAHDLLVVPSRLEAWSDVAVAAMRAGVPVLATPVGALGEIVEAGVSGWHAGGAGPDSIRAELARLLGDRDELTRVRFSGAPAERARLLADPEPTLAGYERLLETAARPATRSPARPLGPSLVTGIVPYYRSAGYVAEAVGSLLGQTHPSLEVLIVNDGSFEPADSILSELAADPRVRVVTQPNGGESSARNLGALLARGEYVAMLDADNLFEPGFVERALAAYRRTPRLAYVTCWLRMIGPDGAGLPDGPGYAPLGNGAVQEDLENWDGDTMALLPTRLFSEEGYRYVGSMHSDWELYRQLRRGGRLGAVIPERLARYRILPGSLLRGHSDRLLRRGWDESRGRLRLRGGGMS